MRVGVIGRGFVGDALFNVMRGIAHQVSFYDPRWEESKFEDVMDADIMFVCVPTFFSRSKKDFDLSIVRETFEKLDKHGYKGVACIKSTVSPGCTKEMQREFPDLRICMVPEFMIERAAERSMRENKTCVVGTNRRGDFEVVARSMAGLQKKMLIMDPTAAEIMKLTCNSFKATRVMFANAIYETCKAHDVDYDGVLGAMAAQEEFTPKYLGVRDPDLRSFGGYCLPKDTACLNAHMKRLDLPCGGTPTILDAVMRDRDLYPVTVLPGSRDVDNITD